MLRKPKALRMAKPKRLAGKERRSVDSKRPYGRKSWQRFRMAYLRQHPVCELAEKCSGDPATVVDHIVPLNQGGAHLDESNSQALCVPCHSWKTVTQDMGRNGSQWVGRKG